MKYAHILLGALLLTACTAGSGPSGNMVHGVAADTLTARLELRLLEQQGDTATVAIVLHNPEQEAVQSVRAWVQFDPLTVRAQDLSIIDQRLNLFAPDEKTIDRRNGLVKIGAAVSEPMTDATITVATFTVRTPPDGRTSVLSFYDWREDGAGHTAVLTLQNDATVNVLFAPNSLSL